MHLPDPLIWFSTFHFHFKQSLTRQQYKNHEFTSVSYICKNQSRDFLLSSVQRLVSQPDGCQTPGHLWSLIHSSQLRPLKRMEFWGMLRWQNVEKSPSFLALHPCLEALLYLPSCPRPLSCGHSLVGRRLCVPCSRGFPIPPHTHTAFVQTRTTSPFPCLQPQLLQQGLRGRGNTSLIIA